MALLGNLKGSAQVFQDTEFYNGVVSTSGRFDNSSSSYLNRTVAAGNRKTWTLSFWFKRCDIARDQDFLTATGSGATGLWANMITSGDKLQVYGNNQVLLLSNHLLRDTSAWYNIIFRCDTTQSTASNRLKIYLNGSEITSFETDNRANLTQDGDFGISSNVDHHIGANQTPGNYLDGYLAEYNFTDGVSNEPTAFGETKNGVWIPIEYTGSYGTYGFRLKFDGFLGTDTSGNGNNWTPNGFSAEDTSIPDCPENNFCTLNPIARRYGQSYVGTFTEGALKVASGGNSTDVYGTMAINQIASQGGIYFEVRCDSLDNARSYIGVLGDNGVNNKSGNSNGATYSYPIKGVIGREPRGYFNTATDASGSIDLTANTAFADGDIVGVAILSDGKFFFHRNGTYFNDASGNTGNPSTGANPIATIDLTEGDWMPYVGYNSTYTVNFGQDGTFNGQETSGGNQDANGIGDFKYAVPTNCLALCTSNMAEPTIGPDSPTQADDHFNTVIYTGDGNNSRTVTGVGFQPDWLWIKRRDGSNSHVLVDSSRGSGSNDSLLSLLSNVSDAEYDLNDHVRSLDSDGFTLDDDTDNTVATNNSSQTYVAWNWKANGGTTSSNSDGTTTSTVQANTTAGFSIITYTGNATAGATIGHGLGKAPKWVITKARSGAYSWLVGHDEIASDAWTDALLLDTDGATSDSNLFWNDTAPNSTVVTLGGAYNPVNGNNVTYVMYAFAEIEGYSKFGSYTGNGSSDGTFVYTGFRPAWVLVKVTNQSSQRWELFDSVRSPNNPSDDRLSPNLSDAEYAGYQTPDFLSNGFKLTSTSGYTNDSGNNYIYIAFAEAPFKYANAR